MQGRQRELMRISRKIIHGHCIPKPMDSNWIRILDPANRLQTVASGSAVVKAHKLYLFNCEVAPHLPAFGDCFCFSGHLFKSYIHTNPLMLWCVVALLFLGKI